jgi:hypothetical protein
MGSIDISELDKERIIQRNGIRLLGFFLLLVLGSAAALLLPWGLLWVADNRGWLDLPAILGDINHNDVFQRVGDLAHAE